jgi:hypothetical protein
MFIAPEIRSIERNRDEMNRSRSESMNGARNWETKRRGRRAEKPRSPHQNALNFPLYPFIEVSPDISL